jgi:hypothetical protein
LFKFFHYLKIVSILTAYIIEHLTKGPTGYMPSVLTATIGKAITPINSLCFDSMGVSGLTLVPLVALKNCPVVACATPATFGRTERGKLLDATSPG